MLAFCYVDKEDVIRGTRGDKIIPGNKPRNPLCRGTRGKKSISGKKPRKVPIVVKQPRFSIPKKQMRKPRRKRKANAQDKIRKLQKTMDLLTKRAPFTRLVREIIQGHRNDFRVNSITISALQEASEAILCHLFEDGLRCTAHAKRVTLFLKRSAWDLRGDNECFGSYKPMKSSNTKLGDNTYSDA